MKFLFLDKVSENKARITTVNYDPDSLTESQKQGGILVEYYEDRFGYTAYYDYDKKEVIYESTEEQSTIDDVKKSTESLIQELAATKIDNMKMKLLNENLTKEVANTKLKVMEIENKINGGNE